MRRFVVGQSYVHFDWFTGGRILYEVHSVENGIVYFNAEDREPDGSHNRGECYEIQHRDNGDEFIVMFTYKGADCVIEANEVEEDNG